MTRSSFLMKLTFVLFALACASTVAGFCAWKYWNAIFIVFGYGTTDFGRLNAENQAMKTPLNLTMYAMPVSFWCAAAGLFAASAMALLLDISRDLRAFFAGLFSLMRSKDGHHA